jgi:glucose/arabinose dehydrogenase
VKAVVQIIAICAAIVLGIIVLAAGALYLFGPVNPTAFVPSDRPVNNTLGIELPDGFTIEYYAEDVPGARSMTRSPSGILFVGTKDVGKLYALVDTDNDNHIDKQYIIAAGLDMPNGVAFHNGSLYVAENSRIIRYDNIEANLATPPAMVVVYPSLPREAHHGWKFIRFGPDGKLYVPIGAPCNNCNAGDPYASIARMNADGSNFEIYARGIRNTVGFDWRNNELWFTDNGRDMLGDDAPPDELNYAPESGMHFGYPFCHGKDIQDDEFTNRNCEEFTSAAQELGPHVAALGIRFYNGTQFPSEYQGVAFIAEHGSWNRKEPIGYRITTVRLENNTPVSYDVFASGWLTKDGAWGRPVDVEVLPDGSILVSDDKAGAIYRISYASQTAADFS